MLHWLESLSPVRGVEGEEGPTAANGWSFALSRDDSPRPEPNSGGGAPMSQHRSARTARVAEPPPRHHQPRNRDNRPRTDTVATSNLIPLATSRHHLNTRSAMRADPHIRTRPGRDMPVMTRIPRRLTSDATFRHFFGNFQSATNIHQVARAIYRGTCQFSARCRSTPSVHTITDSHRPQVPTCTNTGCGISERKRSRGAPRRSACARSATRPALTPTEP